MPERTSERPDSLVESHKGYDPRLLFFYPLIALLLLVLIGGLAYQQLFRSDIHQAREKQQNQRRILMPGPRGDIYDREGRLLVKNRARFSVTLNLDELRSEFTTEVRRIRKNYLATDDKDLPSYSQLRAIARYTVVQRYLDQANGILGRTGKIDAQELDQHFRQQLLLPYTLVDELKPEEYAKLIEQLPVRSPLQVYASSTRDYPYGSAAAHTLGYVLSQDEVELKDFPGEGLQTFRMKGTTGKDGLEAKFNDRLQGKPGGTIYVVDPSGYRVEPAVHRRVPIQGQNLTTSLDIDLQIAAEDAVKAGESDGERISGAVAAIDVATGEVLALASMPNYNLNDFTPRLSSAAAKQIEDTGAWTNRAIQGLYAPGSTFKILTAIAGFRSGFTQPRSTVVCDGALQIGERSFPCHDRHAHGLIDLPHAISSSCNVFFYTQAIGATAQTIYDEAHRFHLDRPTSIELLHEQRRMLIPSPEWKKQTQGQNWFPGDTANTAIGQGFVRVTPLQMACFMASVARNETHTPPTLVHNPERTRLRTEPIGITPQQHKALIEGMRLCVESGTASRTLNKMMKLGDLKIAGKTGTAQKTIYEKDGSVKGNLNFAWFIGFAPHDNPQIAIAVVLEGSVPGEEYGGGLMAAPVAGAVFKKYFEKKDSLPALPAPTSTAAR